MKDAKDIVQDMMDKDAFSQWLGVEILEMDAGRCKLRMTVREEMVNGFGVAHGGITYSFADSALAFACNSRGIKSMSIETSISHTSPVYPKDVLIADAREISLKNKVAIYAIKVQNQKEELVAHFKGTVYRSGKEW
ncbi:MAG: hydroxyphenylacetyl-CoA thioesterase PaaI [Bacteroidetes bacterium]|jgi:acyl-CoA thioesterase|nr:hydroxyphenylacetyl-CoA thioesterase PaaI [Bacteroidota bacterium]